MMVSDKIVCEKCDVRIPKNRPRLICCFCNCVKHYRCNNLTKKEAVDIIDSSFDWLCQTCLHEALPVNAVEMICGSTNNKIKTDSLTCTSCLSKINDSSCIVRCHWCDNRCHKKCVNGSLGCNKCCINTIPGFTVHHYELFDVSSLKPNSIFNPYDHNHLINQLGLNNSELDEPSVWSDLSDKLSGCSYSMMKHIRTTGNGNLRILSLNIRSLVKILTTYVKKLLPFSLNLMCCVCVRQIASLKIFQMDWPTLVLKGFTNQSSRILIANLEEGVD